MLYLAQENYKAYARRLQCAHLPIPGKRTGTWIFAHGARVQVTRKDIKLHKIFGDTNIIFDFSGIFESPHFSKIHFSLSGYQPYCSTISRVPLYVHTGDPYTLFARGSCLTQLIRAHCVLSTRKRTFSVSCLRLRKRDTHSCSFSCVDAR